MSSQEDSSPAWATDNNDSAESGVAPPMPPSNGGSTKYSSDNSSAQSAQDIDDDIPVNAEAFDGGFFPSWLQRFAGVLSALFSFIGLMFIREWVGHKVGDGSYADFYTTTRTAATKGWGGGLSDDLNTDWIFNYHPVLMTAAMSFMVTCSLMTYLVIPMPHVVRKVLHTLGHLSVVIMVGVGLYCVGQGKDGQNSYSAYTGSKKYFAHMSSVHSWVGIVALMLYFQQFVIGIFGFWVNQFGEDWKKWYMTLHRPIGIASLVVNTITILMGIQEYQSSLETCEYKDAIFTKPTDAQYAKLPEACRVSSSGALFLVFSVILALYALIPNVTKKNQNH